MVDQSKWDWETREKEVPFDPWKENFNWVEEPYASPDGEQVAAVVNIDEGEFNVCVNGETWESPFE
ncbi:MAG: WD40 repeat domain-containing protein, partial [Deltaproteobacteria bacterium]|nr:WD40 repeat domain-containing protein [Deltaproteobacteria bacterium]